MVLYGVVSKCVIFTFTCGGKHRWHKKLQHKFLMA